MEESKEVEEMEVAHPVVRMGVEAKEEACVVVSMAADVVVETEETLVEKMEVADLADKKVDLEEVKRVVHMVGVVTVVVKVDLKVVKQEAMVE